MEDKQSGLNQPYFDVNQAIGIPVPFFTASQMRSIARAKLKGKWQQVFFPVFIYVILSLLPGLLYAGFYISDLTSSGILSDYYSTEYAELAQNMLAEGTGSDVGIFSSITNFTGNFASLYQLILTGIFGMAISTMALKVLRGENVEISDNITGFNRFGRSFCIGLMVTFFTFLWKCLFILPGTFLLGGGIAASALSQGGSAYMLIFLGSLLTLAGAVGGLIFTMRYNLSYFLAADDSSLRSSGSVTLSVLITRGRILRLFSLVLSFIGWMILAYLPLLAASAVLLFSTSFAGHIAAFVLMIVFLAACTPLTIYMETSKAVFYSTLTGNFRPSFSDAAGIPDNSAGEHSDTDVFQG